jgi:poly-gamma-glutamate synthesis protein (capsule biosynthesis protein)
MGPLGLQRLWIWQAKDIICTFLAQDLDGDGRPEIVLGSYDRRLYLVDADGEVLWAYDTGGSVRALATTDVDGDGTVDIVAGAEDGVLRAFSIEGALRWEVPLNGRVTAVTVLDVDTDGQPEIVAGSRPGSAWVIEVDGTVRWQQETPGAPTGFAIVGAVHNRGLGLSTEAGSLLVLTPEGTPLWDEPDHGYIRGLAPLESGLLAGGRDGQVRLLTMDGRPRLEAALDEPVPVVAPRDLDGDGAFEVLAGSQRGLTALDTAGQALWGLPTDTGVWVLAFPDLEGDGEPEIVAGTDGGEIIVLDHWGRVRGHTYVPFRVHGLLAADLDGDGRDELLARASNHLYVFGGSAEGEAGEQQPFVETLAEWPVDTPLLPAAEDEVVLMAVGDIMLGRAVEPRALMYGPEFPFASLIPLLGQGDIVTGNMEGVIGFAGSPLVKSFTFRSHPDVIEGLQAAGFNVLTLANNHARDFGSAGMSETIALLETAGIHTLGAGPRAYEPVFIKVNGLQVALLARTYAIGQQNQVAWADEDELRTAVAAAKEQADVVVVHLHAGIEYSPYANETQRRLAQAAADGGAALVIGHHSHSLQEVEWIGDTLVAYSLGDFVFDIDDHEVARDAVVLRVILGRDGVVSAEWIPAHIVDDVQPRPLQGEDGRPVVEIISLTTEN